MRRCSGGHEVRPGGALKKNMITKWRNSDSDYSGHVTDSGNWCSDNTGVVVADHYTETKESENNE